MKNKTLQALLCLSVAAVSAPAFGQIVGFSVNFDSGSAAFSDNFTRFNDGVLGAGLAWGEAVGTNGTGGLAVTETAARNLFYRPSPASDATSTFNTSALPLGNVFSTSIDFKWADTASTATTLITAGFVPSNTSQTALTSAGALAGSIIRNGSSTVTLRMRNGTTDAGSITFNQTALTAGDWYRLGYDITRSDTTNTFNYTVSLFAIGANGIATQVLFNDGTKDITIAGSVANSALYGDANAFFAYDIRGGATGISHVDNFTVGSAIPEPSAFAAFAGAVAMGAGVLRRRRR